MEVGRSLAAIHQKNVDLEYSSMGNDSGTFKCTLNSLILKCSLIHLGERFYDFLALGAKGWIWHPRNLQYCLSLWQHTKWLACVCSICFAMEAVVLMLK